MRDVEAIHGLWLLTASGNLFWNVQFHGHQSYFRKDFKMLIAAKEGAMIATTKQKGLNVKNTKKNTT